MFFVSGTQTPTRTHTQNKTKRRTITQDVGNPQPKGTTTYIYIGNSDNFYMNIYSYKKNTPKCIEYNVCVYSMKSIYSRHKYIVYVYNIL